MMDLYVYDENFNRLGIVGSFSYLLWRKRYSSFGEAELHVDATTHNIELLRKGNILYRNDDNEAMYIYYRGFEDDEEGRDVLTVKCFSLLRWLDRRLIWGNWGFFGRPDGVIRSMIDFHAMRPSNADRIIPITDFTGLNQFGDFIYIESSYVNLLDQVLALCNTYDLGINSVFNGKKMFINLYVGTDRTVNQSENPRAILSKEFSNVLTRTFEEADNDFKNTIAIIGDGEGTGRTITSIEQGTGLNRRETVLDASNTSRVTKDENGKEITYTQEEYVLVLKQKGLEKLLECEEYISFDCEMDVTKNNTRYGEDFFLGDIITMRDDKLGVIMNSRVVEADEIYQDTGKRVQVKVGKSIPTLTEKIKRMVKS